MVILRVALLSAVFILQGCSNEREMLWWDMMEAHGEFKRVNKIAQLADSSNHKVDSSILTLSDTVITYIERLEALLFATAALEDKRNDGQLDAVSNVYYDQFLASDTLIGIEPGRPAQHKNSAEALRIFLEAHKRAVEQTAGLTSGELDIFLFTGPDLVDYSGTLNHWANVNFYHVPFATVIERLTRMKIAVRLMEHHALKYHRVAQGADSLLRAESSITL